MRLLQLDSLELVGGGRRLDFEPGLNVVFGPIATGKTTVVKLLRALLASVPDDLPEEVRDHVTALRSTAQIAGRQWNILRRLVTTDTLLVELVSGDDTALVPARKPTEAHPTTFSDWLLGKLDIPNIRVPTAPSRPESDPTPVTLTDYMNYCILRGDEIDNCVFGHSNPFRDIKRKYVFEIAYGLYDVSQAERQAELRAVDTELTYLRGQSAAAARIFAGTELESIEAVRGAHEQRLARADQLLAAESEIAEEAAARSTDTTLRLRVDKVSRDLAVAISTLRTAEAQLRDLEALVEQLRSQEAKLTRARVAGHALVDFEFILCPRCGHSVDQARGTNDTCTLCLQVPPPALQPEQLLAERDRIADQIIDTLELVGKRQAQAEQIQADVSELAQEQKSLSRALDLAMATFVSDRQERIAQVAAERSRVTAEAEKYDQFLVILERSEKANDRIAKLAQLKTDILRELEEASSNRLMFGRANVAALEERFTKYLRKLNVPTFGTPIEGTINSATYLPVVSGRSFDRLSSQGLQVLVNVAHALAHHTVAIDRDLPLPGLLVIDGASSNVGTEGYDAERLSDLYSLLGEVSEQYKSRLQIIVVDNSVPPNGRDWIRVTLGESDRLVRLTTPASETSAA